MAAPDSKSMRRPWYWLALVPLILGASRAFLKYTWWAAMHGALYGIPSETRQLAHADANANLNWWLLVGLAAAATIVATILIPPISSSTFPATLKGLARFVFALVLVAGLLFLTVAGMSATGYFLQ